MNKKTKKGFSVFGELLGLVIGLVVVIYLVPMFPFVTKEYAQWLPIAITTSVINSLFQTIGHIINKPFSYLFKVAALIPSMYSTYRLAEIFPFDFNDLNALIQFALYISVFAMGIALIVHSVQFITGIVKLCLEDSEVKNKDG